MALTIAEALACSRQLEAGSDSAALDVQVLLQHLLQRPRAYLYTWPERGLSSQQEADFLALLARRINGEPVAHLVGFREFWTLELEVSADTLIPRPDTELLVELALELPCPETARVADLGTGTGAIALALASERPGWQICALDRVPAAVALAERNRRRYGFDNVRVLESHWCQALREPQDMIVSNPPYIDEQDPHLQQGDVRFEPASALVAGESGLADIRCIATQALRSLQPGGWLLLEHGWQQGSAVQACLRDLGYHAVSTRVDLSGQERVTLGRRG